MMDTAFGDVTEFGNDVVAKFHPFAPKSRVMPSCIDMGPGFWSSMDGKNASADDVLLTHKGCFVSGGWQRGSALRGLDIEDGKVTSTGESSLGEPFVNHLKLYDPENLEEILHDFHGGIDTVRDYRPEWVEIMRPHDPVARDARSRRLPSVKNSKSLLKNLLFVTEKVSAMVAMDAVRCVGTVAECMRNGTVPWCIGKLTLEETKPR